MGFKPLMGTTASESVRLAMYFIFLLFKLSHTSWIWVS